MGSVKGAVDKEALAHCQQMTPRCQKLTSPLPGPAHLPATIEALGRLLVGRSLRLEGRRFRISEEEILGAKQTDAVEPM